MTSGKAMALTCGENDFLIECTRELVGPIGVLEVDDRVRIAYEVALGHINSRKTPVTAQDPQNVMRKGYRSGGDRSTGVQPCTAIVGGIAGCHAPPAGTECRGSLRLNTVQGKL